MSERTPQQAYLGLQKLARSQGRNTQQLFELYIHERLLARLAASRFAERFVLKGGMLQAGGCVAMHSPEAARRFAKRLVLRKDYDSVAQAPRP